MSSTHRGEKESVEESVFISMFVALEKVKPVKNKLSYRVIETLTLTRSLEPKRSTAATLLLWHGNCENPESVTGQSVRIGTQNLADVSAAGWQSAVMRALGHVHECVCVCSLGAWRAFLPFNGLLAASPANTTQERCATVAFWEERNRPSEACPPPPVLHKSRTSSSR